MPLLRQAGVAAAKLIVIVPAAAGTLALCYQVFPQWRPDPRESVGAEMKVIAVEPLVSREASIKRTSRDQEEKRTRRGRLKDGLTVREQRHVLRERGTLVYVRIIVNGFKGRDAVLRWSMHSARSGRRVSLTRLHDQTVGDVYGDAPTDRLVAPVWVPRLHKAATLFVRLELVREGTILAVADSPAFSESRR